MRTIPYFHRRRLAVSILLFTSAVNFLSRLEMLEAGEPPPALARLEVFKEESLAVMSNVRNFEIDGTCTIVWSEEALKVYPEDQRESEKEVPCAFRLVARRGAEGEPDSFSMEHTRRPPGEPPSTDRLIYEGNWVVAIQDENAVVGKRKGGSIAFPSVATLVEYSFLAPDFSGERYPQMLPSELGSVPMWDQWLAKVESLSVENDGRLHVKFMQGRVSVSVIFSEVSGNRSFIKPTSARCTNAEGIVLSELEIKEYTKHSELGRFARRFDIRTYKNGILQFTYVFELKDIKTNTEVDKNRFVFDPAAMSEIWDADNDAWINVPK